MYLRSYDGIARNGKIECWMHNTWRKRTWKVPLMGCCMQLRLQPPPSCSPGKPRLLMQSANANTWSLVAALRKMALTGTWTHVPSLTGCAYALPAPHAPMMMPYACWDPGDIWAVPWPPGDGQDDASFDPAQHHPPAERRAPTRVLLSTEPRLHRF